MVIGLAVLGSLSTAFQLAGVVSMLMAKVILAGGIWIFLTAEVALSGWIRRTGLFRPSVILLSCLISGLTSIVLTVKIAEMKRISQGQSGARIEVTDVVAGYTKPGEPVINIYFANRGNTPSLGFYKHYTLSLAPIDLDARDIYKCQEDTTRVFTKQALLDLYSDRSEMLPDTSQRFFSIPGFKGEDLDLIKNNFARILSGEMRLYVFVTMVYRDRQMQDGFYGVTENCFYLWGTVAIRHNCGDSYRQVQMPELLIPASPKEQRR